MLKNRLAFIAVLALVSAVGCSSAQNAVKKSATPMTSVTDQSTSSPSANTPTTTASTTSPPTSGSTPTASAAPPATGARVSGNGYSLAEPTGWQDITATIKASNPKIDKALGAPQTTGFRTNFNVVVTPTSGSFTQAQLQTEAARELTSVTHTRVTSLPTSSLDGTTVIGQTSQLAKAGVRITFIQYLGVRPGNAYALTMTFAPQNSAQAKSTLASIVSSWQWA